MSTIMDTPTKVPYKYSPVLSEYYPKWAKDSAESPKWMAANSHRYTSEQLEYLTDYYEQGALYYGCLARKDSK